MLSLYKFVDDDDDMIHDDQFNLFSRDTHIRPFFFQRGGWMEARVECEVFEPSD